MELLLESVIPIISLFDSLYQSTAKNNRPSLFSKLPHEMLVKIFKELSLRDLTSFSLANHQFQDVSKDDFLWQCFFKMAFLPENKNEAEVQSTQDLENNFLENTLLIYKAKLNFKEKLKNLEEDLKNLANDKLPLFIDSINLTTPLGQRVYFHFVTLMMTQSLAKYNDGTISIEFFLILLNYAIEFSKALNGLSHK